MTRTALIGLACCAAAAPALAQSLGLGNSAQQGPAQPSRQQASQPLAEHPDRNQGRFVALGGEFGSLRTPCSQCHQVDGMGDPSGAFPRLAGQTAWYLYSTLRDFADGKRKSDVMDPIAKEMSDSQMQDVAAYFASLPIVSFPPPLAQDRQAIEHGHAIAHNGAKQGAPACDSCHGQQGAGNPPLYPSLAGQYAPYLQNQLQAFKTGKRQGDPMGVMQAVAKELSDQQIKEVAAYYASISAKPTMRGAARASNGRTMGQGPQAGPQAHVQQNAKSNAEAVQHVGATPEPKLQKGTTVVPGGMTEKPKAQGQP